MPSSHASIESVFLVSANVVDKKIDFYYERRAMTDAHASELLRPLGLFWSRHLGVRWNAK
jgi:hypothetical protein